MSRPLCIRWPKRVRHGVADLTNVTVRMRKCTAHPRLRGTANAFCAYGAAANLGRSGRRRWRWNAGGAPPAERPRGLTSVAKVQGGCMNVRYSLAGAVAVALTVGAVSSAAAQADTTRRTTSQQRVRVTKESTGEVATRRDSAFIRDSVARADSVARLETARRDSVARADSMARMERMRVDSIARDSSARADSIARASQATTTTSTTRTTTTSTTTPTTTTTATTDTVRNPTMPSMSSDSYGMRKGSF